MNTWPSKACFLEGWKSELADGQEFVQSWTISVDTWVKTSSRTQTSQWEFPSVASLGRIGTEIPILAEIRGSFLPGYAQFGINLWMARTFGCVGSRKAGILRLNHTDTAVTLQKSCSPSCDLPSRWETGAWSCSPPPPPPCCSACEFY